MSEVVEIIAKKLVTQPDKVVVNTTKSEEDGSILIELNVADEDKSRVIGKKGSIAHAIRTLLKTVGIKEGVYMRLKILD